MTEMYEVQCPPQLAMWEIKGKKKTSSGLKFSVIISKQLTFHLNVLILNTVIPVLCTFQHFMLKLNMYLKKEYY